MQSLNTKSTEELIRENHYLVESVGLLLQSYELLLDTLNRESTRKEELERELAKLNRRCNG